MLRGHDGHDRGRIGRIVRPGKIEKTGSLVLEYKILMHITGDFIGRCVVRHLAYLSLIVSVNLI